MADTVSSKHLILRAGPRQVSPMVIRLISVSDQLQLPDFHDIFRAIPGWDGDLGYINLNPAIGRTNRIVRL